MISKTVFLSVFRGNLFKISNHNFVRSTLWAIFSQSLENWIDLIRRIIDYWLNLKDSKQSRDFGKICMHSSSVTFEITIFILNTMKWIDFANWFVIRPFLLGSVCRGRALSKKCWIVPRVESAIRQACGSLRSKREFLKLKLKVVKAVLEDLLPLLTWHDNQASNSNLNRAHVARRNDQESTCDEKDDGEDQIHFDRSLGVRHFHSQV